MSFALAAFSSPLSLMQLLYHMFFAVCNSILCYLCHNRVIPHVYGEYDMRSTPSRSAFESSPRVWEIYLLARANTQPIRNSHSLCVVDESRIFLDGDPQINLSQFSWS